MSPDSAKLGPARPALWHGCRHHGTFQYSARVREGCLPPAAEPHEWNCRPQLDDAGFGRCHSLPQGWG